MAEQKEAFREKLEPFEPYPVASDLKLETYGWEAACCMGCAGCKYVDWSYVPGIDFAWGCPSWQQMQWDQYGACGKLQIIDGLLEGWIDYTPTVAKLAYHCTLCGACDVGCKRNLDLEVLMALESLRVRLVEKGLGPPAPLVKLTENIETKGNRYGLAEKKDWMPDDAKPVKKADLLYWPGCISTYQNTEISTATARILTAAKVDWMVMDNARCCGNILYTSGQLEKAKAWAEENLKRIRQTGAKTVVTSCAECYKTLKVDYPKILGFATDDLGFKVVHLTELVDQWVKEGVLKFSNSLKMKMTYHDACNLSRLSEPWIPWEGTRGMWGIIDPPRRRRRGDKGVYQQPRDVLAAIGVELVEMPRHHESAFCCCGGAGVKESFPELASFSAEERLREAATTGVEAIVSASPRVKENLSQSIKAGKGSGIKEIHDISELIAKAI